MTKIAARKMQRDKDGFRATKREAVAGTLQAQALALAARTLSTRNAEIYRRFREGETSIELGRCYGVCSSRIRQLIRREKYKETSEAVAKQEEQGPDPRRYRVIRLNLPKRTATVLIKRLGRTATLADACEFFRAKHEFLPNFGPRSMAQFNAMLVRYGLEPVKTIWDEEEAA